MLLKKIATAQATLNTLNEYKVSRWKFVRDERIWNGGDGFHITEERQHWNPTQFTQKNPENNGDGQNMRGNYYWYLFPPSPNQCFNGI